MRANLMLVGLLIVSPVPARAQAPEARAVIVDAGDCFQACWNFELAAIATADGYGGGIADTYLSYYPNPGIFHHPMALSCVAVSANEIHASGLDADGPVYVRVVALAESQIGIGISDEAVSGALCSADPQMSYGYLGVALFIP